MADSITDERFWVFTDPAFTKMALGRWHGIAEGRNPDTEADMPGTPPAKQPVAEIQRVLAGSGALRSHEIAAV